jgi:hypothetical protein
VICLNPIRVRNPNVSARSDSDQKFINAPCGKCVVCTRRKARQWSFRLEQEYKNSECASFVTLTYNDDSLPINEDLTYPELYKPHVSQFMKRLRRQNEYHHNLGKMTYYAVGEYGGQTQRPHYHAIIFNSHPNLNHKLHDIWKKGNVHVDAVTKNSISYVTGYVIKRDVEKSKELGRQPEFSLMSKGLGKSYLQNAKYHLQNETFMVPYDGGEIALPNYYKRKIFDDETRQKIGSDLTAKIQEQRNALIDKMSDNGVQFPKAHLAENNYRKARALQKRLKKDKL